MGHYFFWLLHLDCKFKLEKTKLYTLFLISRSKTLSTEYRLISFRFKRQLCFFSTLVADRIVHDLFRLHCTFQRAFSASADSAAFRCVAEFHPCIKRLFFFAYLKLFAAGAANCFTVHLISFLHIFFLFLQEFCTPLSNFPNNTHISQ